MTGVIYARYSSDNQREESIEGQLRECQAFAKKNDITLLEPYIDRALSAKTDNRPNFQKMIKDSAAKKFDVVIVWKLDRFARNRFDSAHYKSVLRKNGVKVVSATEAISEGAEGILLESMLEGMAEYYSAELSEKVVRGLTENALKCKYNGGTLPIGYTIDENQFFQIDPVTAPAVLEAFKKYAKGATMQEITDELNIKGIRTVRGIKISLNTVTRMLHNRRYIGEYQYRDVVVPNGIPAIVPTKLFEQVQERAAANKKAPAKHKAEDEYLLTTKLFCGYCKCLITGESGTSHTMEVHRYYKCRGTRKGGMCKKKTIKKKWIEEVVILLIQKFIFDDVLLDRLADSLIAKLNAESSTLPILRKQLAEIEKGIDNLVNAIQAGIITQSTKQRLEQLEAEKSEISVQILKEEISKPTVTKEDIIFYLTKYRKLNMKQLDHRRRLIDSFVNAIYLFDDYLVITFNYKEGTKTITFAEIEEAFGSDLSSLTAPYRVFITDFRCGHSISLYQSSKFCSLVMYRSSFACSFFLLCVTKQLGRKIFNGYALTGLCCVILLSATADISIYPLFLKYFE